MARLPPPPLSLSLSLSSLSPLAQNCYLVLFNLVHFPHSSPLLLLRLLGPAGKSYRPLDDKGQVKDHYTLQVTHTVGEGDIRRLPGKPRILSFKRLNVFDGSLDKHDLTSDEEEDEDYVPRLVLKAATRYRLCRDAKLREGVELSSDLVAVLPKVGPPSPSLTHSLSPSPPLCLPLN